MPRLRIIILDQVQPPKAGIGSLWYRYCFWADVPTMRQPFYAEMAGPTKVSAWKDATAADNTNLQNGSVVERVDMFSVPDNATIPQLQATMIDMWTKYQADITNNNPWVRYGTTFDGTTWRAGGIT